MIQNKEEGIKLMREFESTDYNDYDKWTPCQFYGHKFIDGICIDCGERSD